MMNRWNKVKEGENVLQFLLFLLLFNLDTTGKTYVPKEKGSSFSSVETYSLTIWNVSVRILDV
jgi:hypothetical protein